MWHQLIKIDSWEAVKFLNHSIPTKKSIVTISDGIPQEVMGISGREEMFHYQVIATDIVMIAKEYITNLELRRLFLW